MFHHQVPFFNAHTTKRVAKCENNRNKMIEIFLKVQLKNFFLIQNMKVEISLKTFFLKNIFQTKHLAMMGAGRYPPVLSGQAGEVDR